MLLTKKIKKQIKELEEDNNYLKSELRDLSETVDQLRKDLEDIHETLDSSSIEKELANKANEPWAGFSVSEITKDGRVAISLDWNEKFIEHLKINGIDAGSEEDTVGVWFASLMKEMGEEISEEEAEKYRKTHNYK